MAKMRLASPNEQRAISREHLGFYNSVVIGAVYDITAPDFDVKSSRSFYSALKRCIDTHPTLSVVVRDGHTDHAFFKRVPSINLDEHIVTADRCVGAETKALPNSTDELEQIEALLPSILDHSWAETPPPWMVTILPLEPSGHGVESRNRCFVAFAFSHALGDGIIGFAFHRAFREGMIDHDTDIDSIISSPITAFPAPFDTAENLPISWGFLLQPLLAVLLPKLVTEVLGLRANASVVSHGTWTGAPMFFEKASLRSRLKLIEIKAFSVENVLQMARKNDAKLTATLVHCFVRALSKAVPQSDATNFVSGIAVNMRRAMGVSNDEMGLFVNACYETHERVEIGTKTSSWTTMEWDHARCLTEKLASSAMTLRDQPVGLLRYIPSINKWTADKVGKQRDSSFDVSNLGAYEDAVALTGLAADQCRITKMIFARPANVTSAPIALSAVSVKDGSLVLSLSWQPGALGIAVEDESAFVERLCTWFKEGIENVGKLG